MSAERAAASIVSHQWEATAGKGLPRSPQHSGLCRGAGTPYHRAEDHLPAWQQGHRCLIACRAAALQPPQAAGVHSTAYTSDCTQHLRADDHLRALQEGVWHLTACGTAARQPPQAAAARSTACITSRCAAVHSKRCGGRCLHQSTSPQRAAQRAATAHRKHATAAHLPKQAQLPCIAA
jgi:hypothetical protein